MRLSFVLRLAVVAAFVAASAGSLAAKAVSQTDAELSLGTKRLVGIWACTGSGDGKPVTATIRWFHIEDGSLSMTLHPVPGGKAHPTIMEQWQWEDDSATTGYQGWRTVPDPSSFDQASFTFHGTTFKDGKMVWIRNAAGSTMSRTFTWLGADHLGFVERYGARGAAEHDIYKLDCKRVLKQEPPPQ